VFRGIAGADKRIRLEDKVNILQAVRAIVFGIFFLPTISIGSARAYDLGRPHCGGVYGGLNIWFSRKLSNFSDVDRRLAEYPWAKTRYRGLIGSATTTLSEELKRVWPKREHGRGEHGLDDLDIDVPIGSEQYIAQKLVSAGIAERLTYASGVCGGADVSYAVISKDIAKADLTSPKEFADFLRAAVQKYLETKARNGTVSEGPLVVAPVEPHYAIKRFTIAVPSEASRGPQAKGTWDKFDIIFALFSVTTEAFNVVVSADKLTVAPKTSARDTPPTAEFFKAVNFDAGGYMDYTEEYIVAAGMALFIAGAPRKCDVEGEGFSATKDGPFRCLLHAYEE
jgi:hypothetical protein